MFAYIGEWQLPLDSDERYVSGFVQMSSDSRVIVGAESSIVQLMYICQLPGTRIQGRSGSSNRSLLSMKTSPISSDITRNAGAPTQISK